MRISYEDVDALTLHLRRVHRTDLVDYIPSPRDDCRASRLDFWADAMARFNRGEWQDAVTNIEQEYKR